MTSLSQVRRCREWAARYLELNWNPLPKRSDDNRPALHRYSKLRDCGLGRAAIANWTAEGIQLATGGRWGLAVIDLDGPEASEVWRDWTVHRAMPRTWEVASGGGGRHLYFRVPAYAGLPTRNSTRALWLGSDRHSAIELIADRGLIVAPPSRHPKTGRPYEWTIGPDDSEHPADLPEWIASLARPRGRAAIAQPRPDPARPRGPGPVRPSRAGLHLYDRQEVVEAIPDPLALARSWGLRIASDRPNDAGWVECHAIGREDRNPSAMFGTKHGGGYWEPHMDRKPLSIFDLAIELGIYPDFPTAVNSLGQQFCGRQHVG